MGETHADIVALDADLAVSTQSMKFGKKFPSASSTAARPRPT